MSVNIKMELDFSEQIKNLNILKSAEMQTRPDNAEMVMKNKAESPEVEKMKSSEICEDCGKPDSECEC